MPATSKPEKDNLPTPSGLLKQYGLRASKAFGQNFLLDQNITDKIAKSAGSVKEGTVIEIGPGPGGLTRSLLNQGAKHVIAVELDERVLPLLEEYQVASENRLEILHQDATKTPVWELGGAPRKVVANLPYNVSTVLLFQWLEHIQDFSSLTLMFQKEVANRICAKPGESNYGRLSVIAQWLCHATKLFDLPPSVFTPPPKVTSTVVHLEPRKELLHPANYKALEHTVKIAFEKRRKMLRQSLKPLFGENTETALENLGIDPKKRAEDLSVEDFCQISCAFSETL